MIFFGILLFAAPALADSWIVKQVRNGEDTRVLSVQKTLMTPHAQDVDPVKLRSFPRFLAEGQTPSKEIYEEYLYRTKLPEYVPLSALTQEPVEFLGSEVRTLVNSGPVANRINLTILGDGYTEAERARFFEDAARIKDDLFRETTFSKYLSLFNVHAVFVPSRDSGLTDGSKRKNTAFGLYRSPAGSKRAIMPGNTMAIDQALALAPANDYAIILANDDYYGGLGGQYAITTRSVESGSIVLRHELGHNFGDVGEEYDGGSVYTGANSSSTASVSWDKWLQSKKVYEAKFLAGNYAWQNLNGRAHVSTFNFPAPNSEGPYSLQVLISSVGWSAPDEVSAFLDGTKAEYTGSYTKDRSFYQLLRPEMSSGTHELRFEENVHDGDNVLAFAQVSALPAGYDTTPGKVAAFATFSDWGTKTYRPTHASCPMRDMLLKEFCAVDKENMWIRFLERVSLVDDVVLNADTAQIVGPQLDGLTIDWFKLEGERSRELLPFKNKRQAKGLGSGQYRVTVQFNTTEVRSPTSRFTVSREFNL
jgi:hypothetical protein